MGSTFAPRTLPGATLAALFGLAYFVSAEVGYALSLGPTVGATFWPPAGVTIAALLLAPGRRWAGLVLAGVVANAVSDGLHGQTLAAGVGFAAANLGEPLLAAAVLRRIVPGPLAFTRLPELITYTATVVGLAAPVGAGIGALTADAFTVDPPDLATGWRTWWVGDAVGAVVLGPTLVRAAHVGVRELTTLSRWLEAGLVAALLVAVTAVVFTAPPTSIAAPFLVFPVLLWASVRFGLPGVGGALCLVVLLTTHWTASGHGPFSAAHLAPADRLVSLQAFVGVAALSFQALAVVWDERTRAETALRQAHTGLEARHRRLVDQAPVAILKLRPDGRVRDVNPAGRQMWPELRPDDRREVRWGDLGLQPLLERAFLGEVVDLPRVWIQPPGRPEGDRVCIAGTAFPVKDDAGRVVEVVVIERDLTVELRAQHQLREALDRAEEASRLKDEFLAVLSHELRTPLSAILGWTHLLREGPSPALLVQGIGTIERNARAQARMIEDLLDMSRIGAGKIRLALGPVDLTEVVWAAVASARPAADARGVGLTVTHDGQPVVHGDPERLQQVAGNLIGNAVKFTGPGGQITVSVTQDGPRARISVADTGVGIAAELLGAVFEPFRQGDGSITRRHGGLGLGLTITRQLVELHGGRVSAHSDGPDRGATFVVELPVAVSPSEPAAPSPEAAGPDLRALRVLVVDDDPDARELVARLLAGRGARVDAAGSAEEALSVLAAGGEPPVDVVVSDIAMPDVDGYELVRRIRASGSSIRVVAVTAFARAEDRARAAGAGFAAHVTKPIDPQALFAALSG